MTISYGKHLKKKQNYSSTIFSKKSAHVKKSCGLSIFLLLLLVGLENVAPLPKGWLTLFCWIRWSLPSLSMPQHKRRQRDILAIVFRTDHFLTTMVAQTKRRDKEDLPYTHICLQLLCIHTVYIHSEAEGNNCSL